MVSPDRSAQRATKLVLVVDALALRKIIVCVVIGIAVELEGVAVELVGARLSDHVDQPA